MDWCATLEDGQLYTVIYHWQGPPSTQQTGRAFGTLYINDSGEPVFTAHECPIGNDIMGYVFIQYR